MAVISAETITQVFLERVRESADKAGFRYRLKGESKAWRSVTFKTYFEECRAVSALVGNEFSREWNSYPSWR
jgi:hypothetical protein